MSKALEPLFNPRSVAVIGASSKPGKSGYDFTKELLEGGFEGKVYPINPNGGNIDGFPILTSLDEADGPIDLALVLVNKKAALTAIEDCAVHGVKVAVMYTAGFAEMGAEGKQIQDEMVRVANEHGMRIVGPNCMGIFSAPAHLNLTGENIPAGRIGLVSQSGNIGFSLWYDARHYLNTGFSHFIGFGNQSDIAVHEYIEFLSDEPNTDVIIVYVEGLRIGSGTDFINALSSAARKKPVVVMKGGRSRFGSKAATSHTGSLAGNDAVFTAALEKAGVIEVTRLDELLPVAQTLMLCPPLKGRNIAVAGSGGGHMIVSADAADKYGFKLPPFSAGAYHKIADLLFDFAPKGNPFDQAGTFVANMDIWAQTTDIIFDDKQYDGIFIFGNLGDIRPEGQPGALEWSDGMRKLIDAKNRAGKPIVAFSLCAHADYECNAILREGGLPVFDSIDIAMRCMKALYERGMYEAHICDADTAATGGGIAPELILTAKGRIDHNLTEPEEYELMKEYGLRPSEYRVVKSAAEAAIAAEELGYPVVMKIVSPEIIHKSDIGGVRTKLYSAEEAAAAYDSIMTDCSAKAPDAKIQGALIAKQAEGVEMIAGIVNDPQFGPVLMMGSGGVFVEIMKDVRFSVLPAGRNEIREKLMQLKAYPLLCGARGTEKADFEALVDFMYRLGAMGAENHEIAELDINPVFASASGAVAADARIIIK